MEGLARREERRDPLVASDEQRRQRFQRALSLPGEVGEGLVGFCHLVHVVAG